MQRESAESTHAAIHQLKPFEQLKAKAKEWWASFLVCKPLFLSSLAFSLMTVCVKQLGGRLPVSEIVLVRSLVSIGLTGLAMRISGVSPLGQNRRLLLIRGLCGSIALLCFFEAITNIPLASATVLQYTYPTFTAAAAWMNSAAPSRPRARWKETRNE